MQEKHNLSYSVPAITERLNKLARKKLVKSKFVSNKKKYESGARRNVFTITSAGKKFFKEALQKTI
jgi:DNA-binding PadR family transcriptional regulator